MRIGFDARMMGHPGIGRYISNLLNAMLNLNTGHEFILFGNGDKLSALSPQLSACKIVDYNAPIYSLQEQFNAPFSKYNLDILHCPNFNIPYLYNGKLITTIHDLIYLIFPQSAPSMLARAYANIMIARSVTKSSKIIAVSKNTKKDILRFFKKAEPEDIIPIYEAAGPSFKKITDADVLDNVKQRHNLPGRFILFVSSLKYHKNLQGAVKAFLNLKSKLPDYKFVVIGRLDKRESKTLNMLKNAEALYIGEVTSDDLVCIYSMASALIHPSFYEGFGLTILEAMACGVPVVCSSAASLPEVGHDAVLQVDPNDINGMSEALYKVLTDTELRKSLIQKGSNRVNDFSWDKTAKQTMEIYQSL